MCQRYSITLSLSFDISHSDFDDLSGITSLNVWR